MSGLRKTTLTELHGQLGAKLVDFAGWSMPVWYDGATEEHLAVRSSAGLFDLGHMGELFVRGPAAGAALDHALLVHASAMPVGRARYTMICDARGGIIDDLITYRLGADEFLVVANASNATAVFDELVARSAGFDAVVADETDDWALIAIQGPESAEILQTVVSDDLSAIRYYRIDRLRLLGADTMVARTGYTGEDGFELFVRADAAIDVWEALTSAGGERVRPCGLAARDTLRLEAGMPLYGNELTIDTTPFDVGAARLVAADAVDVPDHVGRQELLAAAERPHQQLIGLLVDGRRPARAGYSVRRDGVDLGVVTSGALSPTLGRPIAMARVGEAVAAGTALHVDVRGTPVAATVVDLPFYQRS